MSVPVGRQPSPRRPLSGGDAIGAFAAALAGLYPARRAAKLAPTEALATV